MISHFFTLVTLLATTRVCVGIVESQGPLFHSEPRPVLEFANDTGALLECSAHGSPTPTLDWLTSDGTSVEPILHLREILANGSLFFPPFGAESYRHDVHSAAYRCLATNKVGTILSGEVNVRAVVKQHYDVQVRDAFILAGNTASLHCEIPAFVKEQVSVTSWVRDSDSFNIYPTSESDGKYHMVPTGELLVYGVVAADRYTTYRCRTVHRITGRTVESSSHGRVIITEHRTMVSPSFSARSSPGPSPVKLGEAAVLTCLAQGFPPPDFRWERASGQLLQMDHVHTRGGVLVIGNTRADDAGRYICHANNSMGAEWIEFDLSIVSSLQANLMPHQLTVDLGRSAELSCLVSGQPKPSISWAKDGVNIVGTYKRRLAGASLHITEITREDQGMYQCFAKNDHEMVQSTAELRLGDAAPQLVYKFIEQTMSPGPSVSLKCIAGGIPEPHFTWTLDGFPLPQTDRLMIGQYLTMHGDVISHVNVSSVRVADGGEYRCVATNRVQSTSHAARLNIYGSPMVRPMATIAAVAGHDLNLKCPVAGYPISSITWEKDGQLLPISRRQAVSSDGTLAVSGVDRISDSGSYTCTAKNKQNHQSSQVVHIDVKVPPKIEPFSFPTHIQAGTRVHVTCVVSEGDSPIKIEWRKGDKKLTSGADVVSGSSTSIIQIDEFDLALRILNVTPSDNGNYSCLAKNDAAVAVQTALLLVHVPPRIAPFSFNKDLSEGVRAQVTCVIEKGDPPFTIAWFKDSEVIPSTGTWGLKIIGIDAHSSTVVIESLTAKHTGNFTCLAKNSVAEVAHTAQLLVSVPPRWISEPLDQQAAEGLPNLAILCQADGFPIPTITWRKAVGNLPGNYRDIEPSLGMRAFKNGSLVIHNLKEKHEGYYLCEAVNGIGAGLGKVIHLTVNAPARFAVKHANETARLGNPATMKCEVRGDHPLKLVWRKAGSTIDLASSHYRYTVKETNSSEGLLSEISIASTSREDGGRYYCMASNPFGRDESSLLFYILEPPDLQRNVHVIDKGSRFVKLGWILSIDGNSPITQYSIEYKTEKDLWHEHTSRVSVPGSQASATVEGLRPATAYTFRLFAENQIGKSQPSDVLDVTTEGEKPSGPPTNVRVDSTSPTELRITWDPPEPEFCNGEILGYHIGYKEQRQHPDKFQYKSVFVRGEYLISELREFTRYNVVIQAYNGLGPGPTSDEITISTLEGVPSAPPRDVKCESLNSQSIQIAWEPLSDSKVHGVLKGYKVLWQSLDHLESISKSETKLSTGPSVVVHGLERHANYSIQVLAFTRAGDGAISAPISCRTEEDVPEAPADIKAVTSSSTGIIVSWLPPAKANGVLTSYTLQIRTVGSSEGKSSKRLSAMTTRYEAEGLSRRGRYEFAVAAVTRVGEGPYSPTKQLTPSSEVRAAIVTFGEQFTVPWKGEVHLPCLHVGAPEVKVTWKQWGQQLLPSQRLVFLPDGDIHITDLRREDGGNYSCNVENRFGADRIVHRLTVQIPPSAPLLHATSSTPTSVTLQWKQGDDGGSPVRAFILYFRINADSGDWEEVVLERHSTGHVLRDLRCGTSYQFKVTARNEIATGNSSEIVKASTEGTIPSAAPSEGFVQTNSTVANVRLDKWLDGGCPMLFFEIEYRRNSNDRWTLVSNSVQQQDSFSIKSLQPNTEYQLRVRGNNMAGSVRHEYRFHTLPVLRLGHDHGGSGTISPSLNHMGGASEVPFFLDLRLMLPVSVALVAAIIAISTVYYCLVKRNVGGGQRGEVASLHDAQSAAALDNKQNLEQREQYYATVRKPLRSPVREIASLERIPEYSEDIYPYATFQLNEATGVDTRCTSGAPQLQTFLYREADTLQMRESSCDLYEVPRNKLLSSRGPTCRQRKTKSESEEYDTLGSDTDTDRGTSSRTESSNQLDEPTKERSGDRTNRQNVIRRGGVDSKLPDLERKSFPRRSRPKLLQLASCAGKASQQRAANGNRSQRNSPILFTTKLDPPTGFTDSIELSEAECDLDSNKRRMRTPRLGVRDFTIAV